MRAIRVAEPVAVDKGGTMSILLHLENLEQYLEERCEMRRGRRRLRRHRGRRRYR